MKSYNRSWYLEKETKKELTRHLKYFIRKKVHMIRNEQIVPVDEVFEISRYTLAEAFLDQEGEFVESVKRQAEDKGIAYSELLEDIEVKIDLFIPQQYHVAKVKLRSLISGETFTDLIAKDNYKGVEAVPGMKFLFEENYIVEKSFFKYLESIKQ